METRFVAFYLPQFHPVAENNEWYGTGFSEWTNVTKARKLFWGHYQPHLPSDLGFYDLRVPEIRREQAKMALDYGVSAFCYWNYWFGNGKQMLQMPIWETYKDKSITLPFCLAWANHSWEKKLWNRKSGNEIIIQQEYLGEIDYKNYFYAYLPIFKDDRYLRVDGKLFFAIFDPLATDEIKRFIKLWRELAIKENLGGFFFVGRDFACRNLTKILGLDFDAVYDDNVFNIHHNLPIFTKILMLILRAFLKIPTVFKYKNAIAHMITSNARREDVIPVIAPNWDHSPRSGRNAIILHDCKPKYFYQLVKKVIDAIKNKSAGRRVVMIKSWNEWGEGNHMEPDQRYKRGYLEALKKAINENR